MVVIFNKTATVEVVGKIPISQHLQLEHKLEPRYSWSIQGCRPKSKVKVRASTGTSSSKNWVASRRRKLPRDKQTTSDTRPQVQSGGREPSRCGAAWYEGGGCESTALARRVKSIGAKRARDSPRQNPASRASSSFSFSFDLCQNFLFLIPAQRFSE